MLILFTIWRIYTDWQMLNKFRPMFTVGFHSVFPYFFLLSPIVHMLIFSVQHTKDNRVYGENFNSFTNDLHSEHIQHRSHFICPCFFWKEKQAVTTTTTTTITMGKHLNWNLYISFYAIVFHSVCVCSNCAHIINVLHT